jgi:hypothetical protein
MTDRISERPTLARRPQQQEQEKEEEEGKGEGFRVTCSVFRV